MPRKGPAQRRPVPVDPVYTNTLVTQLIAKVLQDGKKQVAQKIVYTALKAPARSPAPTRSSRSSVRWTT
jgi:small subunit ribosomal protein S7